MAVRTERWRYAEYYGRGAGAMLIDTQKDPVETVNLVNDPPYADVAAGLSGLVQKYGEGRRP